MTSRHNGRHLRLYHAVRWRLHLTCATGRRLHRSCENGHRTRQSCTNGRRYRHSRAIKRRLRHSCAIGWRLNSDLYDCRHWLLPTEINLVHFGAPKNLIYLPRGHIYVRSKQVYARFKRSLLSSRFGSDNLVYFLCD